MNDILLKIKGLSWQNVFEIWRESEESLEHWKGFWKQKGFKSWQDWRLATHKNLNGLELKWALYKVADPMASVPEWRGGMFHSWAKWFYNSFPEQPPRLRDLLSHPGVHNHWFIREIAQHFPAQTTITAVRLKNGDIIVVEGMHRCCALAFAGLNKTPVITELTVALANWPNNEPPLLGTGWEK